MFNRILVPLDGSPLAEAVLPYISLLAEGFKIPVTLLRTFEVPDIGEAEGEHGVYLDTMLEGLRARAEYYLEKVAHPLRDIGLVVRYDVRGGDPATNIVSDAEQYPGTLIAMSSHGRSGLGRWVLGSVTDKVLHAATDPLLVIRSRDQETSPPAVRFRNLIVPLDGSPLAEQILPYAVDLAKTLDLTVTLVRVTPTPASYYTYYGPDYIPLGNPDELREAVDKDAEVNLAHATQKLQGEGCAASSMQTKLLHGDAAGAIIDLARETPDALIAMTTHGRSGIGRWVLGSVADRVVRTSGDPVLLVRAQPIESPREA